MKENKQTVTNSYCASASAEATSKNMQWEKLNNKRGAHGFAAEDGNALIFRWRGHKVSIVGKDNAKNGADLRIDGVEYQLKYYESARESVNSSFGKDGFYRYNGKKLMVPSDQYDEAVQVMRQKIAEGKVPGVTDPDAAKSIVTKGKLSFAEAKNLCKALTEESLSFDVKVQLPVAAIIGGMAAINSFWQAKSRGVSTDAALKDAGFEFFVAGGKVAAAGVIANQFLRTAFGRNIAAALTRGIRSCAQSVAQSSTGRCFFNNVAKGLTKTEVTGVAARNVVTKAARGNIITSAAVFLVDSIPDTYRLCTGKMSLGEFGKSRTVGAAGVAGGSAGYFAGMAVGTAICPGVGTIIGGVVGSIGAGLASSAGMQKLMNLF